MCVYIYIYKHFLGPRNFGVTNLPGHCRIRSQVVASDRQTRRDRARFRDDGNETTINSKASDRSMSGWWYTYPSEKYEVSWADDSQDMEKNRFQTTNQISSSTITITSLTRSTINHAIEKTIIMVKPCKNYHHYYLAMSFW